MVTIEYCEKGIPISDWDAQGWVDSIRRRILSEKDDHYYISTSPPIHLLRAEMYERKIPWDKVQFMWQGKILNHNENARFDPWPDDWLEVMGDVSGRLVAHWALRILEKERK